MHGKDDCALVQGDENDDDVPDIDDLAIEEDDADEVGCCCKALLLSLHSAMQPLVNAGNLPFPCPHLKHPCFATSTPR